MSKYHPEIDVDGILALDIHVHVEKDHHGCRSLDDELMEASAAYFKSSDNRTPTVADTAERYCAANMCRWTNLLGSGTTSQRGICAGQRA